MKKDGKSRLAGIHTRRLVRWLEEWETDRRLRAIGAGGGEPGEYSAGEDRSGHDFVKPVGRKPCASRPGDIYLLYPASGTAAAERPLYVVLLAEESGWKWLAAPFGRFTEPATPGELKTHLRPVALRVICGWNARSVSTAALRLGWLTGKLDGVTVMRALAIIRPLSAAAISVSITPGDIGPPLHHPLDPRWLYLAEEAEALETSLAAIEERAGVRRRAALIYAPEEGPLLLAAEPRERYSAGFRRRKGRKL